jgi:hypothetical protein
MKTIFIILILLLTSCASSPTQFPVDKNITINILTKGPKGCHQQARFDFPTLAFFAKDFHLSQTFSVKNLNGKVINHYRSDFEVIQLKPDRSRFKISILTYDQDSSKLVDINLTFMSSGQFFASASRFKSSDPELGFVEVLIGDDAFFSHHGAK